MKKRRQYLLIILLIMTVMSSHLVSYAAQNTGIKTLAVKLVTKTKNNKNTPVYNEKSLTNRIGAIYPTDYVTVLAFNNKVAKVSYTVTSTGKKKTGWVETSKLLNCPLKDYALVQNVASKKTTTYARDDCKSSIGYISKGDVFYLIGGPGKNMYVLYPINGGFKLGYLKGSEYYSIGINKRGNVDISWLFK